MPKPKMKSWQKIKKSGAYHRAIRKARIAIAQRAREIAAEKRTSQQLAVRYVFIADNNMNNHQTLDTIMHYDAPDGIYTAQSTTLENIKEVTVQKCDVDAENDLISDFFDEEDKTDEEKNFQFRSGLRKLAVEHKIPQATLRDLMSLINTRMPRILPRDPRTLLVTPKVVDILNIGDDGAQYWHNGFENCLRHLFRDLDAPKTISVNINMDGLPMFNSSKMEFWPILFNITEMSHVPAMPIGIFCGTTKSTDLQSFLMPFVDEMKDAIDNGIYINSHKITVRLRCIVCDSPARAYVKGTAYYNAHHGCQKCTTIGEYSHVSNANIFPRTECVKRTDDQFRRKLYGSHHKCDSPLLKLDIDMVQQFPVADSLHLLHLGIMKRLLFGWRDGNFRNTDTKWRAQTTIDVSEYLTSQCKMPAEFHRTVRGLFDLSHWKGTEYRTFLHYAGIVVLKDHLTYEAYEHFLLLFCAVTICTSKEYFRMLPIARLMLLQFIEIFAELYGEHHINSNVHNLSHIVDDVERFGELDTFSTYPFESLLGKIKRMPRNGSRPLVQVAKRIIEDFNCHMAILVDTKVATEPTEPILSKRNDGTNVPSSMKSLSGEEYAFYSKVRLKEYCVGNDPANRWFLTRENVIACVFNVMRNAQDGIQLCCITIKDKSQFFLIPLESKNFNIYCTKQCDVESTLNETKLFHLSDIKCKLVCFPYHEMYVFLPLLHTNGNR